MGNRPAHTAEDNVGIAIGGIPANGRPLPTLM